MNSTVAPSSAGRFLGFGRSLCGRAVSRRLRRASRRRNAPRGRRGLARDHAAAAEFDVVGMRAEGQQAAQVQGEFGIGFIGSVDGVAVDESDFRRFFRAK